MARSVAAGEVDGRYDGMLLRGERGVGTVRFLEHELTFEADVLEGQKTGFFLDQRDNRLRVRSRSANRRVLDVFSSSGGFSVNAAAGGATLVHSIDISADAIAAARRNMALNDDRPPVHACRHEVTTGDAMDVMTQMADARRQFDLVVVDPPSFASRQDQVERALNAYGRLTEMAVALLQPGGTLVQASCSARVGEAEFYSVVAEAVNRCGMRLEHQLRPGHADDHPVGFAQGRYLKTVIGRVEVDR
jgi:23S rRNA (cytosine1962-C5)-methyltransferase